MSLHPTVKHQCTRLGLVPNLNVFYIGLNVCFKTWVCSCSSSSSFELDVAYALCLSFHSNTEAALFACHSSGRVTTTGRLLGSKVGNSIKCLSQEHCDAQPHRESNQGFAAFWLLAWGLNWATPPLQSVLMRPQGLSSKLLALTCPPFSTPLFAKSCTVVFQISLYFFKYFVIVLNSTDSCTCNHCSFNHPCFYQSITYHICTI